MRRLLFAAAGVVFGIAVAVAFDCTSVMTHTSLSGLTTTDDHTQYPNLTGRAGGQQLDGGTAASEVLTLEGTTHATRGYTQYPDGFHDYTSRAVPSAPASTHGQWGVENTSPTRGFYQNDSSQVWRMGYTSWTGICTGLAVTSTDFCQVTASLAATVTEATTQLPAPGAIHAFAMVCGLSAAPGSGVTRTLTLRSAGSNTSLTCAITGTSAKTCNFRVEAGVAIAAGALVDISDVVSGGTATTATMNCTTYWTLDAW